MFTRAADKITGGKGFRGEGKHSTNDRSRKAYDFCQIQCTSALRQLESHRTGNILIRTIAEGEGFWNKLLELQGILNQR